MANNVENKNDDGRVKITDQGIIDLCKSNVSKRHNQSNTEMDEVNKLNVITKENVRDKEKLDAWRNLKYMANKQSIRHKLPFMPPPERVKTKLGQIKRNVKNERDKHRKKGINIETQTDPSDILKQEASKIVPNVGQDNGIPKKSTIIVNTDGDDDVYIMENQSEQVQASRAGQVQETEGKSGREEQSVYNLIEKYSHENKARLRDFFDSPSRKNNDSASDTSMNKHKSKIFEYIYTSLWQIVLCMSHHKAKFDDKQEKTKSLVDHSTQTEPVIVISQNNDNNSAPIENPKEITMSQLTSHLPNVNECDILEQKMQVIHGNYQNIPCPQMSKAPPSMRSNDPRVSRNNVQVQNDPQKAITKRPRFKSPETQEASADNSSNNVMQANIFPPSASRWQVVPSNQFGEGTRAAQQWRQRCISNTARPQWYNLMPPPPPPPPRYNQEPRFATQHSIITDQYYIAAQQQQLAEYQRYQQMEIQKKAWESQLKNYPNCAWSNQLKEN